MRNNNKKLMTCLDVATMGIANRYVTPHQAHTHELRKHTTYTPYTLRLAHREKGARVGVWVCLVSGACRHQTLSNGDVINASGIIHPFLHSPCIRPVHSTYFFSISADWIISNRNRVSLLSWPFISRSSIAPLFISIRPILCPFIPIPPFNSRSFILRLFASLILINLI